MAYSPVGDLEPEVKEIKQEPFVVVENKVLIGNHPSKIYIPSINLNSPIENMGLNDKGEMDVPSGKTDNVGWYKYGIIPGEVGSAVFDAHVFAAFKNLKDVKVGEEIFMRTISGAPFVISRACGVVGFSYMTSLYSQVCKDVVWSVIF